MNLFDPSGFSAIGDYFQGLNDAPPEQAIPGYIGTGLVAGLAVMAVYEGVSASFAAGTASSVSTAATQSGGLGSAGPYARGAGAATVAIQRIKAATEDSVTGEVAEVPTQSAERPVGAGRAHATAQPQKVSIFDPKVGAVACGPATQACIRIAQAAQNTPAGRAVQRAADRYGPQIVNWLRTQGSNIASAVSRFVSNVGPAARGAPAITRGTTVLGHHPGYLEKAAELGARRFNIPTDVWNKMSAAEQWGANQKFLDRLIARGDQVVLSTPAGQAAPGSFFARELQYLQGRGYTLNAEGTLLLPP